MNTIADLIFECKENLSDREYLQIMDLVRLPHKETELFELVKASPNIEYGMKLKIFSLLLENARNRDPRARDIIVLVNEDEDDPHVPMTTCQKAIFTIGVSYFVTCLYLLFKNYSLV